MNEPVTSAAGVARVAVNLRGIPAGVPARGMALIEAGRWTLTRLLDVRLCSRAGADAASRDDPAHRLGPHAGPDPSPRARRADRPPDPARRAPAARRGPGAAPRPGQRGRGDPGRDRARRRAARARQARRGRRGRDASSPPGRILPRPPTCCAGTASCVPARWPPWASPAAPPPSAGDWLADPDRWAAPAPPAGRGGRRPRQARPAGHRHAARGRPRRARPARPGAGRGAGPGAGPARGRLPAARRAAEGRASPRRPCRRASPRRCGPSWRTSRRRRSWPRTRRRLRELGLDPRAIAAAARAGLLLRVAEQVVLAPDAEAQAARILARLPQPFTTAEARQALGTTRRVAIPLLEYLDRAGITQRLPDDRRRLRLRAGSSARGTAQLAEACGGQEGPLIGKYLSRCAAAAIRLCCSATRVTRSLTQRLR